MDTIDFLSKTGGPQLLNPLEEGETHSRYSTYEGNALHCAALRGSEQIVELLLERIPVPLYKKITEGEYGRTPLHFAARDGHLQIVKLLANAPDPYIDTQDTYGHTPLDYALLNDHKEIQEWLIGLGAQPVQASKVWRQPSKMSPLHEAIWNGDLEKVKQLAQIDRESIFEKGKLKRNSLQLAIRRRKNAIVQFLAEFGGFELIKQKSADNDTAVHCAAYEGNLEAMRILIEHGGSALLYQQNKHGRTPVDDAAMGHQFLIIDWLMKSPDIILHPERFWPGWGILDWALMDLHPYLGEFFKNMEAGISSRTGQKNFSKSVA